MDTRTGRIERLSTIDDEMDAKARGLRLLTPEELQEVIGMTRAQRVEWAAKNPKTVSRAQQRTGRAAKNARKRQRRARRSNR